MIALAGTIEWDGIPRMYGCRLELDLQADDWFFVFVPKFCALVMHLKSLKSLQVSVNLPDY